MKNHTPGPWHPQQSESGFVVVYSDGVNRSHVARLFDSALCEEHGSIEANARLIASAPDLLRALEKLLSTRHDPMGLETATAYREAYEVITKAKGGQP